MARGSGNVRDGAAISRSAAGILQPGKKPRPGRPPGKLGARTSQFFSFKMASQNKAAPTVRPDFFRHPQQKFSGESKPAKAPEVSAAGFIALQGIEKTDAV